MRCVSRSSGREKVRSTLPADGQRRREREARHESADNEAQAENNGMRVLIVNKFLHPNGGSETYIFKIGEELQRQGHEVQYFGMEHPGRIVGNRMGSYTSEMEFHSASPLQKLTYPRKIIYSKEAREKLRLVLSDFQPDVVHLNNINFQLTPSVIDEVKAFEPSTRIVYTAHDYQWVCPNHMLRIPSTGALCTACVDGNFSACRRNRCIHNSGLRSILGAREAEFYRKRHTYRLVDQIICPTQFMNDMLSHNPDLKGRCVTKLNFVDVNSPAGRNPDRKAVNSDIRECVGTSLPTGCPADTSGQRQERRPPAPVSAGMLSPEIADLLRQFSVAGYVLYFGRYDEEKGIGDLLNVARRHPEIPFFFAGKGALEEEVKRVPNVRNVGFRSGRNLAELIRNARFAVYPSTWYENCPFSVMEALMAGTPVVAPHLGGIPELIDDGVTGVVYPAGASQRASGSHEDGNVTGGQEGSHDPNGIPNPASEEFHEKDGIAKLEQAIVSLWNDPERCRAMSAACRSITKFPTLSEYVQWLVNEVYC